MKRIIYTVVFAWTQLLLFGQQQDKDSLLAIINKHQQDKNEVNALAHLANDLADFDSAYQYAKQGLELAEKINDLKGKADCLLVFASIAGGQENLTRCLKYALSAQSVYEEIDDHLGVASVHGMLQATYRAIGDFRNALTHAFQAIEISKHNPGEVEFTIPGHSLVVPMEAEVAQTYLLMSQLDSAIYFTRKAIDSKELFNNSEWNFPVYLLATIQTIQGNYKDALDNFRRAVPLASQNGLPLDTLQIFSGMSTLFKKTGQWDSAIHYARIVVSARDFQTETKNLLEAVANLGDIYKETGNKDSAIKYIELNGQIKDSILSNEKNREMQNITFNEKLKEQEIAASQIQYRSRVQRYAFLAGIAILLIIAGLLWRNSRNKQKAKEEIEKAYADLKSTQTRLIQSEKMASLGELTAGIAHEIQNPLNFVNNFSEVNAELIQELEGERLKVKGERNEILEAEIINDIKQNLEKINHHGKRADSIVKGMLQHSQKSVGQKEPTDINALCDEYIRLAYHGLRAKDKSLPAGHAGFNTEIKTDFDRTIGEIDVVPQEMGRVIINLINNAFYAVSAKALATVDKNYIPLVTLGTKETGDRVLISVEDNGVGIPDSIKEKIFQPFFTTKPTGQGTGLGLSLAYDIVKSHDGEIKVESKEGEFTRFIIQLPKT